MLLGLIAGLALGTAATRLWTGWGASVPAPAPEARSVQVPTAAGSRGTAAPSRWRSQPAESALRRFSDVAFSGDAWLGTNGTQAVYVTPTGTEHPLELAAPVRRVFATAGRLFAAAESDGAPFLIAIAPGEDGPAPVVLPLPCPPVALAGAGEVLAAACGDGPALAVSRDNGRSFTRVAVSPPLPEALPAASVERFIDAVAVGPDGTLAVVLRQHWRESGRSAPLLWTWVHVAVGQGRQFEFHALPGVGRSVALQPFGTSFMVAALEVFPDGELRPRLYSSGGGPGFSPLGTAGPPCGSLAQTVEAQGVVLDAHEAAFLCRDVVVGSGDGGVSWQADTAPGMRVRSLQQGGMRLLARGDEQSWERDLVQRSPAGATAIRIDGEAPASTVPPVPSSPVEPLPSQAIREPEAEPEAAP